MENSTPLPDSRAKGTGAPDNQPAAMVKLSGCDFASAIRMYAANQWGSSRASLTSEFKRGNVSSLREFFGGLSTNLLLSCGALSALR